MKRYTFNSDTNQMEELNLLPTNYWRTQLPILVVVFFIFVIVKLFIY